LSIQTAKDNLTKTSVIEDLKILTQTE
jgi:hypothetical protein